MLVGNRPIFIQKGESKNVSCCFLTTSPCQICIFCKIIHIYMERSIRKWVLWILFYNIKFKSVYLPKY